MSLKQKKCNNNIRNYHTADHQLRNKESEKDLGVVLKNDLKYDYHINAIVSKANRVLGLIRRTFSFLNADIVKLLYVSLVRPHLEYAFSTWSPFRKKCVNHFYQLDMISPLRNFFADQKDQPKVFMNVNIVKDKFRRTVLIRLEEIFLTNRVISIWNNLPFAVEGIRKVTNFNENFDECHKNQNCKL